MCLCHALYAFWRGASGGHFLSSPHSQTTLLNFKCFLSSLCMFTNVCVHIAENIYDLVSSSLKTFDFPIYRHAFLSLNCVSVAASSFFPIFMKKYSCFYPMCICVCQSECHVCGTESLNLKIGMVVKLMWMLRRKRELTGRAASAPDYWLISQDPL